jgi:uncharacterized membrane protein
MNLNTQSKIVPRIDYIDYLRGWAVILMIFWHSIDALLASGMKHSSLFNLAQFIGGLVAPSFLFTAGAAFTIILTKYREEILSFRKRANRQLIRILQIFIIAYLLHFPFNNLFYLPVQISYEQYLNFIKVDILHTIAFGLFFMQILFFIVRKEIILYVILVIFSMVIVFLTPYISQYDFQRIFIIEIATYFNTLHNSLFPLFPWLSYLLLGSLIMHIILKYKNNNREEKIINILFVIGAALISTGVVPELLQIKTTAYYNFWLTSPNIFMIKFGIILILIYILNFATHNKSYKMKIFNIYGKESLFVYVIHLLIIYGDNPLTLRYHIGNKCNWLEFLGIYFLLLIIMLILAKSWNKIKIRYRNIKT